VSARVARKSPAGPLCGLQLEPQFSTKVQELMKLEEAAGKKGQFDRQEKLAQKVDAQVGRPILTCRVREGCGVTVSCCVFVHMMCHQMKQECRSALKYIIDLHAKQRMKVYHRHIQEREALFRRLNEEIAEASRFVCVRCTCPSCFLMRFLRCCAQERSIPCTSRCRRSWRSVASQCVYRMIGFVQSRNACVLHAVIFDRFTHRLGCKSVESLCGVWRTVKRISVRR
jgi:hypothetical protein